MPAILESHEHSFSVGEICTRAWVGCTKSNMRVKIHLAGAGFETPCAELCAALAINHTAILQAVGAYIAAGCNDIRRLHDMCDATTIVSPSAFTPTRS